MKKSLSSHSFLKYLFSYSFCLILPIVVFSLLYKTIFLTGYTEQLIEKAAESMDFTFEYLDLKINSLNQMAFQILSSSEFSDAAFQENPPILNYLVMAKIFTNHININEYLYDIWCYN
ncbi:MAG: hypothetical protein LBF78_11385, partial [Treponema sp.]|nr:hypothetical protein [Treponema sp.]